LYRESGRFLYQFESEEKKKIDYTLRKKDPPMVIARRVSEDLLGLKLSDESKLLQPGFNGVTGAVCARQSCPVVRVCFNLSALHFFTATASRGEIATLTRRSSLRHFDLAATLWIWASILLTFLQSHNPSFD
jgi:hypothetical protein